jgi:hypothetical protein
MSAATQTNPGRALLAAVAALMVAGLVFLGPSGSATTTIKGDAGVILLSTGPNEGDNWVRYFADPAGPNLNVNEFDKEQPIRLVRCEVVTDGSILAIEQTGGRQGLGLVSNGLGTRDKNNCATANGQVGVSGALSLELGSEFADPSFAVDLVEIDVEAKQDADLNYGLDGGPNTLIDLNNSASDNGPDAGTGDNEIVSIGSEDGFRSVTFSATGNSKALISIEGGGDGVLAGGTERANLGVNQSLFRLVTTRTWDGELDCGGLATAGDSTGATSDGPAESAVLARGDDTKSDEPCELIPYTFQIEDDNVFFDYEDNGEGNRFLVRIDWDPGLYSPLAPPIRNVDYYNDGVDDYVPGVACTGSDDTLGEGPSIDFDYTHPVSTATDPIADGTGSDFADGTDVPVCLAGEKMVLTSAGWQQTQWWDVTGDPRWN